ncbi:hypothetical protein [Paenibacillus woosongensis]|uniref:Uncharacterized protein n=1 Tax=Paenibacillus woosongensis TaxID=307580 RepID=A0A7X3CLT5_9BACL|nr:hypothetical protein [Paenibacillus woosongensis]MUG44938.1 hypothetical protein [Paenibacillus woosongensis]
MDEQQVLLMISEATKPLQERIQLLESDLAMTKKHVTQAVELMGANFSMELDRVLNDYKEAFREASLSVIQDNIG